MLVAQRRLPRQRGRRHGPADRIDSGHAAHDEPGSRQHLPDRSGDLLGKYRSADGLRQHRIEGHVALFADQHQLVSARQLAVERAGERGSGEAAADDDDVPGLVHGQRSSGAE